MSEEEYEVMKAKGLDEGSLIKLDRHTFRHRHPDKVLRRENGTAVLHLDEEAFAFYQQKTGKNSTIEEQTNDEFRSRVGKEAA